MSTPEEPYRARHAAPRRPAASGAAPRRAASTRLVSTRLAYTAAAVAAGAVPLAAAGAAQAAATPLSGLAGELPAALSAPMLNAPLSVNGTQLPVTRAGAALTPTQALADGTRQLTARLASALPVNTVVPEMLPNPAQSLQMAGLLDGGAVGTLSQGLTPQTQSITGAVAGQTAPLVGRLHQAGLPTVGDVTGQVSQTALPGVGTVGGLTKALPVTAALGPNSPVTGALNSLGGL
ncbi:MAG TPA: hypothetical protein VFU73_07680 [Actinocrinis sp.]|nr:hypothetical protein [Actinocrinis sp.]